MKSIFKICATMALFLFVANADALDPRKLVILGGGQDDVEVEYVSYWTDGASVGNLTNATDWQEFSGITNPTVAANEGYLWLQSDGSIDKLLAVDGSDASTEGEWTLSGINGIDYEDLSSSDFGGNYIYLADIGNNADADNSRGSGIDGIIYKIVEPTITGSNGTIDAGDITAINIAYPGGAGDPSHKDAECIFIDHNTGDLYLITKREAAPGVYKLAYQASYSGTQTLEFLGDMYDVPDVSSASASGNVVGCNMAPTGDGILLKSYDVMYYFPYDAVSETVYEALQATPVTVDGYVGGGNTTYAKSHPSQEPQGEAVTFDFDGVNYYTASVYLAAAGSTAARYPLFKYNRLTKVPTTVTLQNGVSPTAGYAGCIDTYIWDTNPNTVYGNDATFIEDKAASVETDQRKGLLKCDLTDAAIPANATIVGAVMNLYIAQEGQGHAFYKVLTANWTESSTYNTLTTGINDDGTEASTTEDNRNAVNLDTIQSLVIRNNIRLATPQSWVDGTSPNYGWLIEGTDTAGDGQQHASTEAVTASQRPQLILRYTVP